MNEMPLDEMPRDAPPPLLFPRQPLSLFGLLAAVSGGVLRVATVLYLAPIFNAITEKDLSALPGVLLSAGLIAALGALMLFVQDVCLGIVAARVSAQWREGLLSQLLKRSPGSLPGSSGSLSGRILTDLKDVENYYPTLGTLFAETSFLLCLLASLFVTSARITLWLFVVVLPVVLVMVWLGRYLKRVTVRSQERLEKVGGQLQEGFKHHAVIRAFAARDFLMSRFAVLNRASQEQQARRNVLVGLQAPLAQVLTFAAVALLLVLMARSVAANTINPGQLVSYITLVALLSSPAQLLSRAYASLQQARAARERLLELWQLPTPAPTSDAKIVTGQGLRLDHVNFSYDTQSVLQDISFVFPKHGLIALVGESGAGKSTLMSLLLRFLRPMSGEVFLDAQPYATLSEETLRGRVAYVPQGTDLLSGNLRDNILLGRSISDEKIWAVLKAVRLESTIKSLGLEYELREDGVGLSGGQRQRLAVARALLSEPDVLLLDEPSANLDDESERVLLETLKLQANERLVIVVAHRPAIIKAADTVLKLENGQLYEKAEGRIQEVEGSR